MYSFPAVPTNCSVIEESFRGTVQSTVTNAPSSMTTNPPPPASSTVRSASSVSTASFSPVMYPETRSARASSK
jgi:hypothetical protein